MAKKYFGHKTIRFEFKVARRKYLKGLEKGLMTAAYRGYSKWQLHCYNMIQIKAPKGKVGFAGFPPGEFLKSQIKLVNRKRGSYRYKEVDVPTKFQIGSPGWRAWLVIKALHHGWKKLPFERPRKEKKMKGKHSMALPVLPGKVPQPGYSKVFLKHAVQKKQITKRPWISKVWLDMGKYLKDYLEEAFGEEKSKKKTIVDVKT